MGLVIMWFPRTRGDRQSRIWLRMTVAVVTPHARGYTHLKGNFLLIPFHSHG